MPPVKKTITATEASRHLREVLNAVEYGGESFRIARHGRLIAEIHPTDTASRRTRWRDLLQALQDGPRPDPDFQADLINIRQAAGALPSDLCETPGGPPTRC